MILLLNGMGMNMMTAVCVCGLFITCSHPKVKVIVEADERTITEVSNKNEDSMLVSTREALGINEKKNKAKASEQVDEVARNAEVASGLLIRMGEVYGDNPPGVVGFRPIAKSVPRLSGAFI